MAWHAEQLAPAAVQCVFAGHVSQAVDSSTRCAVPCLPAAHAVHVSAVSAATCTPNCPAGHTRHACKLPLPTGEPNRPPGQPTHRLAPVRTLLYRPAAHLMHAAALVAPEKIGLGLTVFVSIETSDHSGPWLEQFATGVSAMPEVMELYRMAGDVDYMLRVVVEDMAAYDSFYKRLISAFPLKNVTSRFAMERVKSTTAFRSPPEKASA